MRMPLRKGCFMLNFCISSLVKTHWCAFKGGCQQSLGCYVHSTMWFLFLHVWDARRETAASRLMAKGKNSIWIYETQCCPNFLTGLASVLHHVCQSDAVRLADWCSLKWLLIHVHKNGSWSVASPFLMWEKKIVCNCLILKKKKMVCTEHRWQRNYSGFF